MLNQIPGALYTATHTGIELSTQVQYGNQLQ